LTVTALAMGAGAVVLSVFLVTQDPPQGILPALTSGGWLAILYIGMLGGALSFFLYAWSLGHMAPTATMILLPLNPIAAVFAGAVFLSEPLSLELFAGLALVIIGIILVVGLHDGAAAQPATRGIG
jgi:drug/metabolite transporter (DMT)-like permease